MSQSAEEKGIELHEPALVRFVDLHIRRRHNLAAFKSYAVPLSAADFFRACPLHKPMTFPP